MCCGLLPQSLEPFIPFAWRTVSLLRPNSCHPSVLLSPQSTSCPKMRREGDGQPLCFPPAPPHHSAHPSQRTLPQGQDHVSLTLSTGHMPSVQFMLECRNEGEHSRALSLLYKEPLRPLFYLRAASHLQPGAPQWLDSLVGRASVVLGVVPTLSPALLSWGRHLSGLRGRRGQSQGAVLGGKGL